jgi:P pilus assembly chaperone PapD
LKTLTFTLLALLISVSASFAQIVISPYVVLIDQKNQFGTFLVSNQTTETQEVTIFFKFGYPASDDQGNVTMLYTDSSGINMDYDLTNMVNAFPKKFTLKPGDKQTVRMTVKSKKDMKEGTYWTRIITSTQSKQVITDTSTSLSASINFVLNQVTTVIYKNKRYENTVNLQDITTSTDDEFLNVNVPLEVKGDSPFFAGTIVKIFDASGSLVTEQTQYFTVYYGMTRKNSFKLEDLKPGEYKAEVTISSDTNPDIPLSDKPLKTPITKTVSFSIN